MKYAFPVAVMNGFTAALDLAISEGYISVEAAMYITKSAAVATREYLKGNTIYGKSLETFAADGQAYENFLRDNKINLAQFGE